MSEFITHFGIDWRLLAAQAVNFFILLFVLKKFAYAPILAMLKKRRMEIENGLAAAKKAQENLKQADILREETLQQARKDALLIIGDAEETGKNRQDEIIGDATKKGDHLVSEAKKIIAQEKSIMGEEVYDNARELIQQGIAQVLGKMPAEERDRELIESALHELKTTRGI